VKSRDYSNKRGSAFGPYWCRRGLAGADPVPGSRPGPDPALRAAPVLTLDINGICNELIVSFHFARPDIFPFLNTRNSPKPLFVVYLGPPTAHFIRCLLPIERIYSFEKKGMVMYSYELLEPGCYYLIQETENAPIKLIKVSVVSDHCMYVSRFEETEVMEWRRKTDSIKEIIELLDDKAVTAWEAEYNKDMYNYEEDEE
jgi:hypothetical protein